MERPEMNEYERRRARTQRCAVEMGKLFTSGHNVQQTPAYEAWRMEYLQSMVDEKYPDLPEGTHSHWTTG